MSIVSAIVLFAVIWFLALYIVLPIRLQTQGDVGEHVEGTHAGSPASSFSMRRKFRLVTIVAVVAWSIIASAILWSGITVRDIDFFNRMGAEENTG